MKEFYHMIHACFISNLSLRNNVKCC